MHQYYRRVLFFHHLLRNGINFSVFKWKVFGNMKTPWWKWRRQAAEVDDCWLIKKKEKKKKHTNQVRRWIHHWQSLQSRAVSQTLQLRVYIKTHITSLPKEKIRKHLREKRQLSSGTTFCRLNQNDFEVRAEVTRSQCYSTATVSIDNTLSSGFREISEADGATVCSTSAQYWDTDMHGNFVFLLDKQPELNVWVSEPRCTWCSAGLSSIVKAFAHWACSDWSNLENGKKKINIVVANSVLT